jgi:hypothetical protein
MRSRASRLIPDDWRMIYNNPLSTVEEVSDFRMEGDGAVFFPMERMRLQSTRDPARDSGGYWNGDNCNVLPGRAAQGINTQL